MKMKRSDCARSHESGPWGKSRAMGQEKGHGGRVLSHFSASATNTYGGGLEQTVLQQQTFHVF